MCPVQLRAIVHRCSGVCCGWGVLHKLQILCCLTKARLRMPINKNHIQGTRHSRRATLLPLATHYFILEPEKEGMSLWSSLAFVPFLFQTFFSYWGTWFPFQTRLQEATSSVPNWDRCTHTPMTYPSSARQYTAGWQDLVGPFEKGLHKQTHNWGIVANTPVLCCFWQYRTVTANLLHAVG